MNARLLFSYQPDYKSFTGITGAAILNAIAVRARRSIDRIDALLFATPVLWYYALILAAVHVR